jgi:hypothetical protein
MSTERSDQYPEVSGEDSGIVPPQGAAKQEWPKKIRTLTANELDRLTIDGLGRFYWDGQLVNYQAHPSRIEKPVDLDQHAMDLLERTARELDPNAPVPSADATTAAEAQTSDTLTADAPALAATPADQLAPVITPVDKATPIVELQRHQMLVPAIGTPGATRLLLTGWQSIGLIIVIVSFLVAAAGMAASGFVAAHDWGCKTGFVKRACAPAPSMPTAPPRPEIPA